MGNTDSLVNLYQTRYIQTVAKIYDDKISNSLDDFVSLYEKICLSYNRQLNLLAPEFFLILEHPVYKM